ncbi:hypothetical protein ACQ4XT_02340 [Halobacillus faecis]
MNIVEKRYWETYCDFIEDFSKIKYFGVPLALVLPYYTLIADPALHILNSDSVDKVLRNRISSPFEIQSKINQYISPFIKKNRKRKGKVVFHENVLRIPDKILRSQFKDYEIILLKLRIAPWENSEDRPLISSIDEFENVKQEAIFRLKSQTNEILLSKEGHPVYSNEIFKKNLFRLIPIVIKQINGAYNFLKSNNISCLVLGTTNSSDTRILSLLSSKMKIPSICLQHGIAVNDFGYLPRIATYQAVYGNFEVDWYIKKGVHPSAIKILGHPRFDEIWKRKPMKKETFFTKLNLNPNKKTILFILHHIETKVPEAIIETLLKSDEWNILIKRRNGKQRYSEQTISFHKKFPKLNYVDDIHLYDVLHNIDAVISYESTIVLEALLAKKNVFMWHLQSLDVSSTNYYKEMNNHIYETPHDLVDQLLQSLKDEKHYSDRIISLEKFIDYYYPIKYKSSTEELKKLIQTVTK